MADRQNFIMSLLMFQYFCKMSPYVNEERLGFPLQFSLKMHGPLFIVALVFLCTLCDRLEFSDETRRNFALTLPRLNEVMDILTVLALKAMNVV